MNPHQRTVTHDRRRPVPIIALGGVLLLLAACGSSGGSGGGAAPVVSATAGSVGVARTSLGTVLTDGTGHTLYLLTADSPGSSSCSRSCVDLWPVTGPLTAHVAGVTATLGSLTRGDGTKQLTVDGMPAYTYAADHAAGATNGQGIASFGGSWWVLGTDGKPMTTAMTPSSGGGGRY